MNPNRVESECVVTCNTIAHVSNAIDLSDLLSGRMRKMLETK